MIQSRSRRSSLRSQPFSTLAVPQTTPGAKKPTFETFIFTVLYTLLQDNDVPLVLDAIRMLLEELQFLGFVWKPSHTLIIPEYVQYIFNPILFWKETLDFSSYFVLLILAFCFTFATYILLIHVANTFSKGNVRQLWPIRVLRLCTTLLSSILAIPLLETIFYPLVCTTSDSGVLHLAEDASVACFSGVHLGAFVIAILTGACLLPISFVSIALQYDHVPPMQGKTTFGMPHGRYNCWYYCAKVIAVIASSLSHHGTIVTPVVIFLLSLINLALLLRYQPNYTAMITHIRAGFSMAACISALVAICVYAGEAHNSNGAIIMGALLLPSFVAGYWASALMLKYISESCISRLIASLPEAKAQSAEVIRTAVLETGTDYELQYRKSPGEQLKDVYHSKAPPKVSVFHDSADVEITARFMQKSVDSRKVALLEELFRRGCLEHPTSSSLLCMYAHYLKSYAPEQSAMRSDQIADAVDQTNPYVDTRFLLFYLFRSNQETSQAQQQGIHSKEKHKVMDLIEFDMLYVRAKDHHRRALKELKLFWQALRSDNLTTEKLQGICTSLCDEKKLSHQYYQKLLATFPSKCITVLRSYASFCIHVENDIPQANEYFTLANELEGGGTDPYEDISLFGEETIAQSAEAMAEAMAEAIERAKEDTESLREMPSLPIEDTTSLQENLSVHEEERTTTESLPKGCTKSRRVTIQGSLLPDSTRFTEGDTLQNANTADFPKFSAPRSVTGSENSMNSRLSKEDRLQRQYKANTLNGIVNPLRTWANRIIGLAYVRIAMISAIFILGLYSVISLEHELNILDTYTQIPFQLSSLVNSVRFVESSAGSSVFTQEKNLYQSIASNIATSSYLSDNSYAFQPPVRIIQRNLPQPQVYVSSPSPKSLASQLLLNAKIFAQYNATHFANGDYHYDNAYWFLTDNRIEMPSAFNVLATNIATNFVNTLQRFVVSVSVIYVALIIVIILSFFVVFSPLISLAHTNTEKMSCMMKLVPRDTVIKALNLVEEELDGMGDNSSSSVANKPQEKSKVIFTEKRLQIIKGLAMTAVLFSSMCVSLLVYLGCFQNIGLFLVDSQSRIYQIERVVGWAAEVITADSTTWIQPQAEGYLTQAIDDLASTEERIESSEARLMLLSGLIGSAGFTNGIDCAAVQYCSEIVDDSIGLTAQLLSQPLNQLVSLALTIAEKVLSNSYTSVPMTLSDLNFKLLRGVSKIIVQQVSTESSNIVSGLVNLSRNVTLIIIILLYVGGLTTCLLNHFLVFRRTAEELVAEGCESVNLLWLLPYESLNGVPLIKRFLDSGVLPTLTEDDLKRRVQSRPKRRKDAEENDTKNNHIQDLDY